MKAADFCLVSTERKERFIPPSPASAVVLESASFSGDEGGGHPRTKADGLVPARLRQQRTQGGRRESADTVADSREQGRPLLVQTIRA